MSRNKRLQDAQEHTRLMDLKYRTQIESCIERTQIYNNIIGLEHEGTWVDSSIIVDLTTQEAIRDMTKKCKGKIAVLNFASYKNPGGGFIKGSMAQEESLCHSSFLYNVLSSQKCIAEFYEPNRNNVNKSLYNSNLMYTPDVIFDDKYVVDVITCAAPNKGAYGKLDEVYYSALKERCFQVVDVAVINKVDILILGAFGCGVFRNNPADVAFEFKQALKGTNFQTVCFAIPDVRFLDVFERVHCND